MITDLRINAKGELEGKYIPPAKWEEMYTKEEVMALLKDIQLDIEGQKFDIHIDKYVWNDAIRVCSELIQQRINELEAESEDTCELI